MTGDFLGAVKMEEVTLIAPCHFGIEAVLKREITDLGYEIERVEDGRVFFKADPAGICRANIFLRTAKRILLKIGQFKADSFEALFENTYDLCWENYIPPDGKVWVTKASSVKSKLFSTVTIQSVVKKAIAKRLCSKYNLGVLPETGAEYPLRVFIMKDMVVIGLDTSGEPLHKRGYRQMTVKAPLEETLAAALIMLTVWKNGKILADPFCGSGTFAIEAAMIAMNIAPGCSRDFTAQKWKNIISPRFWYQAVNEALDLRRDTGQLEIYASDIDRNVLAFAKENARMAEVDKLIRFKCQPVKDFAPSGDYGVIITNPPYGIRLDDISGAKSVMRDFAGQFKLLPTWSAYIISPIDETEVIMGRKADRKRKVYNGMLKTNFYQFLGEKPKHERNIICNDK